MSVISGLALPRQRRKGAAAPAPSSPPTPVHAHKTHRLTRSRNLQCMSSVRVWKSFAENHPYLASHTAALLHLAKN